MRERQCPACGLEVSEAAFDRGTCPCCEHSFLEPVAAPIPPAPSPVVAQPIGPRSNSPSSRNRFLVGVAVAAVTVSGMVGVWQLLKRPVRPDEVAEVAATPPQPSAGLVPVGFDPEVRRVPPVREIAPAPRPANGQHRDAVAVQPAAVPLAPAPRAKADAVKVELVSVFDTPEKKLNNPTGTAEVLELSGTDHLVLTGKVKVLKIGQVNGEAVLDAAGLDVEEIVFTENVNGSAVVKLNAPGGKVRITRQINGSARLTIHAPGGDVVFSGDDDAGLTGGSVVAVTAKRVEIQCLMNGGTKVEATLTAGGSLRTRVMDGGAAVRYKPASADQTELKIETGELRGGATVQPGK